ncbi:4-hydroxymandelate oxidase [Novosphingobium sp. PhB165]|uniref:alpha-hydroxy acid oxidase n=1 Tax=Novosphingobium sp. PhB165 TaxID=2485105 RepID=UPI0010EA2C96|nr:alpha-hydroxy acid oxidase [Novosphingobium sp. PhB165]TCM21659.1 4-hydroxymandelate oxidase [Novosphingobium sp. PhB165]
MRSLADYERRARDHFAADAWEHVQSGSDAELTLADNRAQFDGLRFVPRMLRDLSGGSTALELFGRRYAAPILLAPLAYHGLAHPAGERASMQAATALDTTMVVSTLSGVPLEEIAATARAAASELDRPLPPLWFQLYFQPDRAHSLELVRRAEAAGYEVLVVTVDAAIKRSEFALPEGVFAANLTAFPRTTQRAEPGGGQIVFGTPLADAAPTWADIAWLRGETRLPIVIKGLLSPEDARLALEHGADGIVVSNHGGRVLDGLTTPMAALPGMVDAVEGRVPLLFDGGVRHGTDVLKALALGASAVMVGRPQLHALAVAGMTGVAHMLHILRAEFELAMAQVGCKQLADIDRRLLA